MTGLDADQIWHSYPYACGLQDFANWCKEYAQDKFRFEILISRIVGKGSPEPMEIVSLCEAARPELV